MSASTYIIDARLRSYFHGRRLLGKHLVQLNEQEAPYIVDLLHWKCSCNMWGDESIPCVHGKVVLLSHPELCKAYPTCFTVFRWKQQYDAVRTEAALLPPLGQEAWESTVLPSDDWCLIPFIAVRGRPSAKKRKLS